MAQYKNIPATQKDDGLIVDLSPHANKLMAYEDISDELSEDAENRLVQYIKAITTMSHERVSRRYSHWQEADRAHDVYVPDNATKFREKAVIADTRAVADTVVTYLMSALGGRNPMFQLEGLDRKSRKAAYILERLLHQQSRRGAAEAHIAQHLLDCVRYGFAPTKNVWLPNKNTNKMLNFDPRKCFPDPRVTWGDMEGMQFITFVDHASTSKLLQTGQYPKLAKYPALRANRRTGQGTWPCHTWVVEEGRGLNIGPNINASKTTQFHLGDARIHDESWIRLSGYEVGMPSIESLWLVVSVLDEEVVMRCQLNPYGRQFPAVLGSLFNDSHKSFGQSLYDLLLPLHDIATWLLRSRVDNVQAALNNLIFADPTQVNIADLINRNPWGVVQTFPGTKPGDGVFIAQVPDVTSGHWKDIQAMSELKQRVSAASDAQQGIQSPGTPPTATEVQRLTQLGSQRLGVLARVISAMSVRPLVHMQVQNIQDALSHNGSIRLENSDENGILSGMADNGFVDFNISDLQGDIQYLVIDGTLPLEPTRSPQIWMQLLQVLQQTGLNLEYNSGRIVEEAVRAMGIPDLGQFKVQPDAPMTPSQLMSMTQAQGGDARQLNPRVMPTEDVLRQAERGNLVPMRQ